MGKIYHQDEINIKFITRADMTPLSSTLTTSRLSLRPVTEDDIPALHRILNEADILKYFPNPGPRSLERVEKMVLDQLNHWKINGFGWWVIIPKSQNELIGWNGLYYLSETRETEVGYLLSRDFWGKGYATESTRASLEYGFNSLGLNEIIGLTHPQNIASQNVLTKCGMTFKNRAEYFGMEMTRYSKNVTK